MYNLQFQGGPFRTIPEDDHPNFQGNCILFDQGAVASVQGERQAMEDTHVEFSTEVNGTKMRVLALFDGHAGKQMSSYLEANFQKVFIDTVKSVETLESDMERLFSSLHFGFKSQISGSTALVCIFFDERCLVANVGDSRAMRFPRSGEFELLTEDAKPGLARYSETIIKQGGYVLADRVNGDIAVARYIGNHYLKLHLFSPIFTWCPAKSGDTFLLGCDGLFETLANESVAQLIFRLFSFSASPQVLAREAVRMAIAYRTSDNVSVMIFRIE